MLIVGSLPDGTHKKVRVVTCYKPPVTDVITFLETMKSGPNFSLIIEYLPFQEAVRLRLVCKAFKNLLKSDGFFPPPHGGILNGVTLCVTLMDTFINDTEF